jgi:hypothetical protein
VFNYENEVETRRLLEEADRANLKRDADLHIPSGQRLIVASPNGSLFAIGVADDGSFSSSPA